MICLSTSPNFLHSLNSKLGFYEQAFQRPAAEGQEATVQGKRGQQTQSFTHPQPDLFHQDNQALKYEIFQPLSLSPLLRVYPNLHTSLLPTHHSQMCLLQVDPFSSGLEPLFPPAWLHQPFIFTLSFPPCYSTLTNKNTFI